MRIPVHFADVEHPDATADLTGDCGYLVFLCESDRLRTLVDGFSKENERIPGKK